MRALATGYAGFMAATLVDSLLKLGCKVIGIDCFTNDYLKDIKNVKYFGSPKF